MAFVCPVLPDSLAVAPIVLVVHAPRSVIVGRRVARRIGTAVLVHLAGRGVIGCPDGQAGRTCDRSLCGMIIANWLFERVLRVI